MNKLFLFAVLAVIAPTVQAAQSPESNETAARDIALANKHFERAQFFGSLTGPAALAVGATWLGAKTPLVGRLKAVVVASTLAEIAFGAVLVATHHEKAMTRIHMEKAGLNV